MYDAAKYYINTFGWHLVPIPPGKKGPTADGWNKPENTQPADYWKKCPNDNMGVLLAPSNLVVLDIDNVDETKLLFSTFGLNYNHLLKGAPRILGKPGHDKALFSAPNGTPLSRKSLTWENQSDDKLHTVFELRGGMVQDVLPPSIHPDTKKPYVWVVSPKSGIPPLPKELFAIWTQWDIFRPQLQNVCPWSKRREEPPKMVRRLPKSDVDIIGKFNSEVKITKLLEDHGYKKVSENRYLSPYSTTGLAGVIVFPGDNRIFSHHGSEPFNSSKPHDAFDLFCTFECGGDATMALHRASTMVYDSEIRHGKHVMDALLEPEPDEPDEEFVLGVPPDENLITKWQEFGVRTQDSYPEYHIVTAMVLISHLIKAEMRPQYGTIGNNMWCVILGSSGTSGKSTACDALMALTYTKELSPFVFRLTNKITPEAFIPAMAEHQRRLHHSDEVVGFLKYLRRDYAIELAEDFIKAYDGRAISKTTVTKKDSGGSVIAQNPRLSAIWNTVPDSFGEYVTREQFSSGFFLRPFFIMPKRQKPIKRDQPIDQYCIDLKQEFITKLVGICKIVGTRPVVFGESEYINEWKHRLRTESMTNGYSEAERSALNRIYEQARKVAMNLTLASTDFYNYVVKEGGGDGNLVGHTEILYDIPDKYAVIACDWAEKVFYKTSLKALRLTYSSGSFGAILKILEDGGELSRTDIGNIIRRNGRQISEFIGDLQEDYPVESYSKTRPGAKKPTVLYYLPRKHKPVT